MGSSHSTLSCTRGGALADLPGRPGQRRDSSAGTISIKDDEKDRKQQPCADDEPTPPTPKRRPRTSPSASTATHSACDCDDEKHPQARHSVDAVHPRPLSSISDADTASCWAESERTLTGRVRRDSKYSTVSTAPATPFTVSRLVAQLEEAEPCDHPGGKRSSAARPRYLESGHGRADLADLAQRQRLKRKENYLWLVDCARKMQQPVHEEEISGKQRRVDEWRDLPDHTAGWGEGEDERWERREWKWTLDRLRQNLAGTTLDCVLCCLAGTFDEDDILLALADADEDTVGSLAHVENGAHFIQHIKDARARVAGRPDAERTRASLQHWLNVQVAQARRDRAGPTVTEDLTAHLAAQRRRAKQAAAILNPVKTAREADWGALMDTIRDSLEGRFGDCAVCLLAAPRSEDVDDMLLAAVSDPTTAERMHCEPSAAHYARHVSDARQRVVQRQDHDADAPSRVERARVLRQQWISEWLAHDKEGPRKRTRWRTGLSEEAEGEDAAWWDLMGVEPDAAVNERWLSRK